MALIIPSGWRELEVAGTALREIETLALLERGLADELTVLHGVHWTRIERGYAVFGEIDFVVVSPAGRVLLIEQKSGFLSETPDGLVQKYAGREKRVATQINRTLDTLRQRLAEVAPGEVLAVDVLLYCPDYTVRNKGTAGLAPERIVDAPVRDTLCRRITEALPAEAERPALADRLRRFFNNELQLVPDVSSMVGRAEQTVTRLSEGLATWARRLSFEPFRLRVVGTAGSGKTQLALAVMNDAAAAGRRALYACFNRPLADHLSRVAPAGAVVASFHQHCDRALRAAGRSIDYRDRTAFDVLARDFAALPVDDAARVDELVIDEGQDFERDWFDALLRYLRPGGRVWWLEDPMQRLYERTAPDLAGWVEITANVNFRCPRNLLDVVNRVVQPVVPIEAASPFATADIDWLTYANPDAAAGDTVDTRAHDDLIDKTKRAVTLALQAGFRKQDIVVITFSGRERSALMGLDALGPHRPRVATGRYDLFGVPQYTDGDLLLETVFRFKGQSAPAVVLTEVDFEALDDRTRHKLFVGMTRASLRLAVVASERAATILQARLGNLADR